MKKERTASGHLTVAALMYGGVDQMGWRDGEYMHIVRLMQLRKVPPQPVLYRLEHRIIQHGVRVHASSHVDLIDNIHEARRRFDALRKNPPTHYDHTEETP